MPSNTCTKRVVAVDLEHLAAADLAVAQLDFDQLVVLDSLTLSTSISGPTISEIVLYSLSIASYHLSPRPRRPAICLADPVGQRIERIELGPRG